MAGRWGREFRRRQGGLLLTTAHRAKGLEFDHVIVLDGAWDRIGRGEDRDAPRRLYYVAITRARQTLTLMRFPGWHPFQNALQRSPSVLCRPAMVGLPTPTTKLNRSYRRLSLGDVFLSFAGYQRPDSPVHEAIAALSPGDLLHVRPGSNRWELMDTHGTVVGQLARSFTPPADIRCAFASVLAIATWDRESSDPTYRERLRSDVWEAVVTELVFEPEQFMYRNRKDAEPALPLVLLTSQRRLADSASRLESESMLIENVQVKNFRSILVNNFNVTLSPR